MKHVLLIEDDADDQEIFSMALKEVDTNIVCHTADDAIEGLAKLKTDFSFVPDVIFIDVSMPKINGIECLKEIRSLPRVQRTPVFMFSNHSDPRMLDDSKKLGGDFLLKPSSLTALINKLQAILTPGQPADGK